MNHNVGAHDSEEALLFVDANAFCAGNAGEAQTTRNDSCVAGRTTTGRQNTFGNKHTMNIIRASLWTYQHDCYFCLAKFFCTVGIEDSFTGGSPWRGIQAFGEQAALLLCLFLFGLIETWQEQLIDLIRFDALDSLFLGDETLIDHIDGRFDRSRSGAFS